MNAPRAITIRASDWDELNPYGTFSCRHVPILDGDGWVTGASLTIPDDMDHDGFTHIQLEVGGGVIDIKATCVGYEMDAIDERGTIMFPSIECWYGNHCIMVIRPDDYPTRLDRVLYGDCSDDDLGDWLADNAQAESERALDRYLSSIE